MVTFGQHGNDQLRLKWCGTLSTRHGDIPSIVKEMAMITNELVKIIFCGLILMKLLRMGVSRVTFEETLHPFVFCLLFLMVNHSKAGNELGLGGVIVKVRDKVRDSLRGEVRVRVRASVRV